MGVLGEAGLEARLAALHQRSQAQGAEMGAFFGSLPADGWNTPEVQARVKDHLADKLVALDQDKAEFCHQLILATGARRVMEIGTSYGVSTVYLAAAVRENLARLGGEGGVIGTEYEPGKAGAARALFAETGLEAFIDLREGDLNETLIDIRHPVDFVLMDIWLPMVAPALERLGPHLSDRAVIMADNTGREREGYKPFFDFLAANGFSSLTLPFEGGLEMAVRRP
jgi:predicted O-methyltransferase YrrM